MFRLLPDSPAEAFDLWQVSSKDHKPETGVTVNRKRSPILSGVGTLGTVGRGWKQVEEAASGL